MTKSPDHIDTTLYQNIEYRFELYKGSFDHIPPEKISQAYGCILDGAGKILIVHNIKSSWGLPGGQLEDGENPLEALHREVYEESAVVLDSESIEPLFYQIPYTLVAGEWRPQTVQVRYRAKIERQDTFISDPAGGVDEMKWVTLQEFPEYVKWGDTAPLILKWLSD